MLMYVYINPNSYSINKKSNTIKAVKVNILYNHIFNIVNDYSLSGIETFIKSLIHKYHTLQSVITRFKQNNIPKKC